MNHMAKQLSDREKLFCTYYHLGRCGREAAVGYQPDAWKRWLEEK